MTQPLVTLLHELAGVIGQMNNEAYGQSPVGVMRSSIGGHVRHSLDHIRALADAAGTGQIDYDKRQRGTAIETDRQAALDEIDRLIVVYSVMGDEVAMRPVSLVIRMTEQGRAYPMTSTFGRELAYVLSHTIHHNAIMAAMAQTLGCSTPERFGYAPSTLAYLDARRTDPQRHGGQAPNACAQ
ncbi:MAG: hypothetical protein GC164_07060 [Phycisphaera sp.]|nr:hypothetical protein [Phycisphaera sp.]